MDVHSGELRGPMRIVETLRQDAMIAARMLRRRPGFAIAAMATLALGIGANTAIFSLINATLLEPLPYPEADRIVQLWLTAPDGGGVLGLAGKNQGMVA